MAWLSRRATNYPLLIGAYLSLQLADILTTWWGMSRGLDEANPLMASVEWWEAVLLKLGVGIIALTFLAPLLRTKYRFPLLLGMSSITLLTAIISINNLVEISMG